ncbi:MAG TPA: serine/threonine-protein kinase, partial [Myxococcota bacterium]|nr:serine/threonine-protein kinase [Myxococcota bacterium]
MSFPVPFGRFQLLSRIAVGGMAEVYLARSFGVEGFEKRLVIKKILTGLSSQPRYVDLFVQEAKVCAALSHPNIVQVFELGKVGEEHFISMEHIHGRDLTRVLRVLRTRSERLPMPVAVAITAFVSRALAYAHSRTTSEGRPMRIVHRDVSPHNVILSFEGEVKLLDFGIARPMTDLEEGVRGAGGKQAYMSP